MIFFRENLKIAARSFVFNKMRTLLSLLGIVIGISSVILITSIGKSASNGIQKSISGSGMNSIVIFPDEIEPKKRSMLNEALADNIARDIENVKYCVPMHQSGFNLTYIRNNALGVIIQAVKPVYTEIFNYEVAKGRFFDEYDGKKRKMGIVLGANIEKKLFPAEDGIGKFIRVFDPESDQAIRLEVIGVMQKKASSMGMSFNSNAYIPYETFTSKIYKIDVADHFIASVKNSEDVINTSKRIENYLRNKFGSKNRFWVMSPTSIAQMYKKITNMINLLLSSIAFISLLVGGIGIMNIMLVSVSERYREIGVRKAIGAPPSAIKSQFLIESALLTSVGGIIGITMGLGIAFCVTSILKWQFSVNIAAIVITFIFSSLVGIFFGYYPAVKASKLDAVKALSYE